jgi:hypothetical protein
VRLIRTLALAGILVLSVASAAHANLNVSPVTAQPFSSPDGKPTTPQIFTAYATCQRDQNGMFQICTGDDVVTLNPTIIPVSGGGFSLYHTCPPTITGHLYSGGTGQDSCQVSVRYTPQQNGTATARLDVGRGSNGEQILNLIGTGNVRKAGVAGAAKKRACKKHKHRKAAVAKKKCRKHKKRR